MMYVILDGGFDWIAWGAERPLGVVVLRQVEFGWAGAVARDP